MKPSTHPLFVLYIAWHPEFRGGPDLAKALYQHYRRNLYENVSGGAGLSVLYRSTPPNGSVVPLDVDINASATTAIVLLIDECWANDPAWVAWAERLMATTNAVGLRARVFPVALDKAALSIGMAEQAVRWDKWEGLNHNERVQKLIADLTYQFCRMLRSYLESFERSIKDQESLCHYLRPVEVFLSHSKHDAYGERIALQVRDHVHREGGLATFFDVKDIPSGLRFNQVLEQKVKVSAVLAIHTDSYSSREWCRREIIAAKRWSVPLVVANCIGDMDDRSFPYLGNVPVVRMDPKASDRIGTIVSRLLDEVLKNFLWRCRIQMTGMRVRKSVVFLPRPPELIALAALKTRASAVLVYPDPPLGAEELALFRDVVPKVRLRSMNEWITEELA